jgi:hypothetical protein
MPRAPLSQMDTEYGRVFVTALKLQHLCELAGMEAQARQAREIRRQAHIRLMAVAANNKPD